MVSVTFTRAPTSERRVWVGALLPAHVTKAPETLRGDQRDAEPQVKNFSGVLHADVPIYNRRRCQRCHGEDRAVLGILDVDVSLSRQTAGMVTWMQMAGIATILQFGLVALGTSLVLSFVVVKPLRRLQKALGEVRHGDYPPSLEGARTQEVTALVVGFNDMLLRVRRGEEAEREAQQARILRAEQLATMGEAASSLAHELRNPLSGIKAAVDVIAAEEPRDEPRTILNSVSSELARIDGVVQQLLDFARPKTPVLQRIDLVLVLGEAVLASQPRANERRVRLDTELPAHPVMVRADADLVQQVVLNLVLNAMDATEGAADARVVVSAEVREGTAWCRVLDNGPGVPGDLAATLFRPFTTTKARGVGLGLATSRRLVEVQGGELRLENPGEPGASFAFSLPLYLERHSA